MMLEALFAHQQQQQAFLSLVAWGLCLGLMFHAGALLRRFGLLRAIWDALTAAAAAAMLFLVALRFHSGLRAYGLLGLLLGFCLYMAGLHPFFQGIGALFRKVQKNRRPKAGETAAVGESSVQGMKGKVNG